MAVMLWEGAILPHTATAGIDTLIAHTWEQKQVKVIVSHVESKINKINHHQISKKKKTKQNPTTTEKHTAHSRKNTQPSN